MAAASLAAGPSRRVSTQSTEEFLAYAVKLEEEAAVRFGQLAHAMATRGNAEARRLFRRLSDYSRMHLAEAQARTGFRDIPVMDPSEFAWPNRGSGWSRPTGSPRTANTQRV